MKQNTLWAYGCSYTQGQYLKDNTIVTEQGYECSPDKPSRYAYPKVLARKLKMKCKNRGIAGQSNDAMLHNIIDDFDSWKDNDIVIVMWSGITRKVFYDEFKGTNLIHNLCKNIKWYMMYLKKDSSKNFFDCRVKSGYNRLIVEKLSKNKNIILIQSETDFGKISQDTTKYDLFVDKFNNKIEHFLPTPYTRDKEALDKQHPGQIWHARIANYFYNYIKTLKYMKEKEQT